MADDRIRQFAVAIWHAATVLRGENNDVVPQGEKLARQCVDDMLLAANER